MTDDKDAISVFDELIQITRRLRDPENGCPWDRVQTAKTIAPYTIEEAYEVADAIDKGDMCAFKDELGDLLFQVLIQTEIARQQRQFKLSDVCRALSDKLVRRHPHVFANHSEVDEKINDPAVIKTRWEKIKHQERKTSSPLDHEPQSVKDAKPKSILDNLPTALPSLSKALKIQRRVANIGFDWKDANEVFNKVEEELAELRIEIQDYVKEASIDTTQNKRLELKERLEHEIGDLLMVISNLARHVDLDAEGALRSANHRFEMRFRMVEKLWEEKNKTPIEEATMEQLDELWEEAKGLANKH